MPISHSIHLGRVASHYPPCARCEHRPGGAGSQSPAPAAASELFTDEAVEGVVENQIHAAFVRKLALAAGIELLATADAVIAAGGPNLAPRIAVPKNAVQKIVVAADGRPGAAELLAAASEGLRCAGWHVVELEPMTAPGVAEAMLEIGAAGGFFIGNPAGASHRVGIRLWSRGARPLSAGGGLDNLRRRFHGEVVRPTRSSGPLERRAGAEARLDRFRDLFHALRPLRFVLDTASRPLVAQLTRLLAQTACHAIAPQWLTSDSAAGPASVRRAAVESPAVGPEIHRRRLASLAALVVERQADFGVWIDGDGERLAVVDQRGQAAPSERLLLALACHATPPGRPSDDEPTHGPELCAQQQPEQPPDPRPNPPIVIEDDFDPPTRILFARHGFAVRAAPARREIFAQAMAAAGSCVGGGPSGRIWFAAAPTAPAIPDALRALGLLLQMLSGRDATLSQALDDASTPR
jgi:phosphomannomutase